MEQSPEKAKMPEQHKTVRALGLAIWADKKRLFSQTWVGDAAVRIRLFLICTYLFAIAWWHPPVAAQAQKSGGSDFSKPPLFIGHSHDFSNAKPITVGKVPICYRLCVCASGSLITDIFSCFTFISVSCLHFGQNNGKFSSIVSPRIFTRVLLPHTGHNNHCSAIIANPCFPPKLKVLHFHGANFVRECFCQNESN